jgi:hypothetical protein
MTLLEIILLFILIVILTLTIMNKEKLEKIFKSDKISFVSYSLGFYTVNWNRLKQNKSIVNIIAELSIIKNKTTEDEFKSKWFKQIYFRTNYSLLLLANQLFTNKVLLQEDKDDIKRVITASGILYNFKIPSSLWLIDCDTLLLIVKYDVLCRKVLVNLNNVQDDSNSEDSYVEFNNLLVNIPIIMLLVSKNTGLNRSPNIYILCDAFIKTYPSAWISMGKDIKNLKRLLTICYYIAGIYIPSDYLEVDNCVVRYLKGETIEIVKTKKSHLKLVG